MTPLIHEIVVYILVAVVSALAVIGFGLMVFGWGRD